MDKNLFAVNPPMGWNSWDCYGASVTEEDLIRNADYMAEHLKPYGWEYVVCDIQWSEPTADSTAYHAFAELCMDEYGRLMPSPNRFPSAADGKGFKPIADYIHSKGLKFGIHIMRGIPRQAVVKNVPIKGTDVHARDIAHTASICAWNSDMYGLNPVAVGAQAYYDSLFELYASWGVDFVKVDLPPYQSGLRLFRQRRNRNDRRSNSALRPRYCAESFSRTGHGGTGGPPAQIRQYVAHYQRFLGPLGRYY